jgi:hypothetical protein
MNQAPDLTQYPLPEEYKWTYHPDANFPSYSIAYRDTHKPAELDTRSEAWTTELNPGEWSINCRKSSLGSEYPGTVHRTEHATLDEALRYIHTWVLMGLNGGTE